MLDDEEEPLREMKRSCIEWCTENGIEYIEACALDVDFDKCLSVGISALSAHMWPAMILKSDNKISRPTLPDKEEISEESDYEFEYKVLSAGQLNHGTTHMEDGFPQMVQLQMFLKIILSKNVRMRTEKSLVKKRYSPRHQQWNF